MSRSEFLLQACLHLAKSAAFPTAQPQTATSCRLLILCLFLREDKQSTSSHLDMSSLCHGMRGPYDPVPHSSAWGQFLLQAR